MSSTTGLAITGVSKVFKSAGRTVQALENISLSLSAGKVGVLLGSRRKATYS